MKQLLKFLVFFTSIAGSRSPAAAAATQDPDRVQVGDQAPAFSLRSLEGDLYRLEDLRGEKNAILIFFRGAW